MTAVALRVLDRLTLTPARLFQARRLLGLTVVTLTAATLTEAYLANTATVARTATTPTGQVMTLTIAPRALVVLVLVGLPALALAARRWTLRLQRKALVRRLRVIATPYLSYPAPGAERTRDQAVYLRVMPVHASRWTVAPYPFPDRPYLERAADLRSRLWYVRAYARWHRAARRACWPTWPQRIIFDVPGDLLVSDAILSDLAEHLREATGLPLHLRSIPSRSLIVGELAALPTRAILPSGYDHAADPDAVPIGISRGGLEVWRPAALPHLIVAGTTGAGKTRAIYLIIRHVLEAGRDRLMLVDGKGTELLDYQGLPGVLLLATTVPEALEAARAARAELAERVDLRRTGGRRGEQVITERGRLYLILDEISVLLDRDVPQYKAEKVELAGLLADLARLGRSLGVHCVFGTQRPDARSFPPWIKTLCDGVLALRCVNDVSSRVVMDSAAAAEIAPELRGRAYWRTEQGRWVLVQVFDVGDDDAASLTVTRGRQATITRPRPAVRVLDQVEDLTPVPGRRAIPEATRLLLPREMIRKGNG
jgi:S-DNA-T family DNA segregation ATPase FtsK/SpoIIIE